MYKGLVCLVGLAGAATAVSAGTITVQVRGAGGAPLADAAVAVTSPRRPPGPIRFPWPYEVKQQNISFQPHVLIVPVGAVVRFPNLDTVRHHVYSFSPAKRFELKLYGHEDSRSVTFDKPGIVAIGCNIHDQMSGFIIVVNTPYAAKTDASGKVTLPDVPAGSATLTIWSEAIRAPGNMLTQTLSVPAGDLAKVVVAP